MTGWWVESIINVAVLLMRFFSMSFSIIRISSYTVAVLLMRFPRMSVEPTNRGIIAVLLMRFFYQWALINYALNVLLLPFSL